VIAPSLPVAVPGVVAVGEPGFGYPERWSLVHWLDGSVPSVPKDRVASEGPRRELARDLAEVVAAIRDIDVPPDAKLSPALRWYRGDPLATRDAPTRDAIAASRAIDGLPWTSTRYRGYGKTRCNCRALTWSRAHVGTTGTSSPRTSLCAMDGSARSWISAG
jgi:hypothetical protein